MFFKVFVLVNLLIQLLLSLGVFYVLVAYVLNRLTVLNELINIALRTSHLRNWSWILLRFVHRRGRSVVSAWLWCIMEALVRSNAWNVRWFGLLWVVNKASSTCCILTWLIYRNTTIWSLRPWGHTAKGYLTQLLWFTGGSYVFQNLNLRILCYFQIIDGNLFALLFLN